MSRDAATPCDDPAPPRGRRLFPILTQQPRVPWAWVLAIQYPWFVGNVVEGLSSTMMSFTLRKFVELPVVITLLTSFNLAFNMLVGAACNYLSDRVWTPFGRRRPFLIAASLVSFGFLIFIPLVRQFWLFVALLFLYEMMRDIGAPTEPLEKEVVPPPQRGRGQAITQVVRVLGGLFFSAALIGRFDETFEFRGWSVSGEMVVYWTGAAFALSLALFYALGVRELPPPMAAQGAAASVRLVRLQGAGRPTGLAAARRAVLGFLRDVFGSRQNWAIYLVGVVMMVFWTGLGSLGPLLITEQWGYDKQAYGNMGAITQLVTLLVVLPLGGWIVDRVDRARLFVWCAAGMTLHHVVYYLYARHLAPGGVPPFAALVALGIVSSAIGQVGTLASVAMQFDYMATSQMGTVSAGIGITRTVAALLTSNIIGAWVTFYSWWRGHEGSDYLSGYHYLIVLGAVSTAAAAWFARQSRRGRLVKHGLIEQQMRLAAPKPNAPGDDAERPGG